MVATNDGHYVRKEDARAHEVLLAIQSKSTLDDPERWRFPCDEFYVKTPEEMRAMLPEAEWGDEPFDNTVEIARMCNVDLPIGDKMVYRIPRFPLPEGARRPSTCGSSPSGASSAATPTGSPRLLPGNLPEAREAPAPRGRGGLGLGLGPGGGGGLGGAKGPASPFGRGGGVDGGGHPPPGSLRAFRH